MCICAWKDCIKTLAFTCFTYADSQAAILALGVIPLMQVQSMNTITTFKNSPKITEFIV